MSTLEKPKILIQTPDDFEKKLNIQLTMKEKKEISVDFKPFEVAHEDVLKVQEMVNRQAHEKVKTLRELAKTAKETKEASEKAREGLAVNLETKEEKNWLLNTLKGKGEQALEKGKEIIVGGIEWSKEKIKEFTDMPPWKRWLIGTGLWIWASILGFFWSIAAWFGYNEIREKADQMKKTKEILDAVKKDPKAALEQYGKEMVDKAKWDGGNKPEDGKEKGTLEKMAPVALLGGLATGLFTMLHLPKSITEKIDSKNGASILKAVPKLRKLKLFGIWGTALVAAGLLFAHFESNPETLKELGEVPTDEAWKKSWWQKALDKAKIGVKEGGDKLHQILTSGIDIADGKALREHYEKEGPAEGYVYLRDSELVKGIANKIEVFEKRIIAAYEKNKPFWETTAIWALILKPGLISGGVGAVMKTGLLMKSITMSGLGLLTHHTLQAGLMFAMAANGLESFKHIQVKKDLTEEDAEEFLEDAMDMDEIKTEISEKLEAIPSERLKPLAKHFVDGGKTLYKEFDEWTADWENNLPQKVRELLIRTDEEKISSTNNNGFKYFRDILVEKKRINKDTNAYEALIWKDEKSGILNKVIEKTKTNELITEWDIYELIQSAKGTNIMIFPENNSREEWKTIMWVEVDEHGVPKWYGNNLCINPISSHKTQLESAEKWVIDANNVWAMDTLGKIKDGTWKEIENLTKCITNPIEWGSMLEKMISKGYDVLVFGKTVYIQDYLGRKYILWPLALLKAAFAGFKTWDNISYGEALVEYGQWLAPVLVITAAKNVLSWKWFLGLRWQGGFRKMLWNNTLVETAFYPIKWAIWTIKWVGNGLKIGGVILDRAFAWDYAGIFRDPAVMFKDWMFWKLYKSLWSRAKEYSLLSHWWEEMEQLWRLRELNSKLEKAKWYNDMGPTKHKQVDDIINYLRKEIQDTKYDELRKKLWINNIYEIKPDTIESLLERVKAKKAWQEISVATLESNVSAEAKKRMEELAASGDPEIIKLTGEHAHKKQDIEKLQEEISKMPEKDADLKAKKDKLEALKKELGILEKELKIPKRGINTKARWIAGILVTLGIGAYVIPKAADYIKWDSHQMARNKIETEEGFYGFQKWSTKTSAENTPNIDEKKNNSWDLENKETTVDTYKTPEEFNKHMDELSESYRKDIAPFFDPEWIKKTPESEVKKAIEAVLDNHMKHVETMKAMLHSNKWLMDAFWRKHFVDDATGEEIIPKDVRDSGVKAFMFIHKKNGELVLDYMNRGDMNGVIYSLYESHKDRVLKWVSDNIHDTVWGVWDFALRVAPYTGSVMSGVDAFDSFKKWEIKEWFWNVGWCIGGLIIDFGSTILDATGIWALAGVPLEAAVVTARWAKITKWLLKAVAHGGIMLTWQFVQAVTKYDRSESVKISEL